MMGVPLEPPLTWGAVSLESPLTGGVPTLEFRWPVGFILGSSRLGVDYLGATHGVALEDAWGSWSVALESPLADGFGGFEPSW
jgi:hypothetical protein